MALDRSNLVVIREPNARSKGVFSGYFERVASGNLIFLLELFTGSSQATLRVVLNAHAFGWVDIMEGIFPSSETSFGSSLKIIRLSEIDRAWIELVAE